MFIVNPSDLGAAIRERRNQLGLLKALGLTVTIAAEAPEAAPKRARAATRAVDIDRIVDSLKQPR